MAANWMSRLTGWLLALCRVVVGFVILRTGVQVIDGRLVALTSKEDRYIVGGFCLLLGLHIVFTSLFKVLFPDK
ncbi:MAG: hypothetical protein ABFS19_08780 [Thermodesulfobacteriota bacterium]